MRILPQVALRVLKFSESQWKLLCYGTFTVIGLTATLDQPWLWNTRECWTGWPEQQMTWVQVYMCSGFFYRLGTCLQRVQVPGVAVWGVAGSVVYVSGALCLALGLMCALS